jgi:hypothetical protein
VHARADLRDADAHREQEERSVPGDLAEVDGDDDPDDDADAERAEELLAELAQRAHDVRVAAEHGLRER